MDDKDFGYYPALPQDIRLVFMWLCRDVAWLHYKWQFYLRLYTCEQDTRLLSELALGSFKIIEQALRADMTMSICRLSDPPGKGSKLNLSLNTLVDKCQQVDGLCHLVADFAQTCEPIRRHRNKLLAHRDLNATINPQHNPLPEFGGRTRIDTILDLAARSLNLVLQHFVDVELAFPPLLITGPRSHPRLFRPSTSQPNRQ